jgi:hypothetical protein
MVSRKDNLLSRLVEWLPPIVVSFLLIAACYQHTRTTSFWQDEIFTHLFVTDSFSHMLEANRDTINANPPFYYVLTWLTVRIFGDSEFVLRLTSSIPLCLSAFIMWCILRKRFAYLPCYAALIPNYLLGVTFTQNKEARFYGLYMVLCTIILYFYDKFQKDETTNRKSLFGVYIFSFMLIFTHYFGIIFGGCVLLADMVRRFIKLPNKEGEVRKDILFGVISIPLFVVVLSSWGTLILLWGRAMYYHVTAFKHSWIERPTLRQFANYFMMNSPRFRLIIAAAFLVLVVSLLYLLRHKDLRQTILQKYKNDALIYFAFVVVTVPVTLTYIVSLGRSSIFLDRYLIFAHIGWCLLFALVFDLLSQVLLSRKDAGLTARIVNSRFAVVGCTIFVALHILAISVYGVKLANAKGENKQNAYLITIAELNKYDLNVPNLPVVLTGVIWYERISYYAKQDTVRFYYVVDESFLNSTGKWVDFNLHALAVRKTIVKYYGDPNTVQWSEFVAKNPRFAVVTIEERGNPSWVEYRFKNNPEYTVTQYPAPPNNAVVYLVERRVSPPQRKP